MRKIVLIIGLLLSVFVSYSQGPLSVLDISTFWANSPTATISGTATICSGDSALVTIVVTNGNSSTSVVYTDGVSNFTINGVALSTSFWVKPMTNTIYLLSSVQDSTCSGTVSGTAVVIVNPLPVISAVVDSMVSCNGGFDGTATVSVSSGMAPYTYMWDNTWAQQINTSLSAGSHSVIVTDANGCSASTSVIITEPSQLVVTTGVTNVNCGNMSNGSATALTIGGTSPYTYLWSNGQTTSTINNLSAGTYTVTVADYNNCIVVESVVVGTSSSPIVSVLTSTDVSCNGGSDGSAIATTIGGTSPYTYLWNGPNNNNQLSNSATGLSAGNHFVVVTDANGCTNTTNIVIVEPTILSTTFTSTDVSCDSAVFGTASVVTTGGTAPYAYAWSSGSNTSSVSNLSINSYYVTVTDANGCVSPGYPKYFVIGKDPEPVASINSNGSGISCGGSPVTLTATGGDTYLWDNGQTLSSIVVSPTVSTWYHVTVSNSFGCIDTDSILVMVNPLPIINDTLLANNVCVGDGPIDLSLYVVASPSGGNFLYSGNNIIGTSFIPNMAGAGSHIVTIQYSSPNNCVAVKQHTIIVNPKPIVNLAIPFSDLCLTSGVTQITGNSPSGGYFSGPGVDSMGNITPTIAGIGIKNIQYFYTDVNGCFDIATDVVNIIAPQLAQITLPSTVFCNGDGVISASVNPGGGSMIAYGPNLPTTGSYLASSGAYAFEFNLSNLFGNYQLVYSLVNSVCGGVDTIDIMINETPNVVISVQGPINNLLDTVDYALNLFPLGGQLYIDGQSVVGNVFSSLIWGVGTHKIVYVVNNGLCAGEDTVDVVVTSTVGMTSSISLDNLKIYPNPVDDILNIEMGSLDISEIQIINSMGQFVYRSVEVDRDISLNLTSFTTGIYFIRFINEGQFIGSKKFIKQ